MHRVGLVTAICGAACAEIPDRHEPTPLLEIGVDASTMEVKGELFALQFATEGVRLPSAFEHGGNQLLASDACPEPSLAGISLAPMTTAVGGRQVAAGLEAGNTIRATWTGPAVAQIVVGYQVQYACAGMQVLDGTSTFTIFPSGRVVRNDAVKPTQAGFLDVDSCGGCQAPKGFARFESFWNLASGGDRIQIDNMGVEQMLAPGAVGDARTTCAIYPGYGLAMSWSGSGKPTTEARAQGQPLAFRYDFVQPTSSIDNQLATGSSTIAFGPTGESCTSLAENVELPMLVIDDGGGKPLAPSAFGIYEYPTRIAGRVEIRTQSADYLHGVAFRLDLGEPGHLRIERASGERVDYVLQRDGNAFIIWIDGGIAHDDPLVIEAS